MLNKNDKKMKKKRGGNKENISFNWGSERSEEARSTKALCSS